MASAKDTFESHSWRANSFACGAFRGSSSAVVLSDSVVSYIPLLGLQNYRAELRGLEGYRAELLGIANYRAELKEAP